MSRPRLRKRIPVSPELKAAIRAHPAAYALIGDLAGRGIYVQLDERGVVFTAACGGNPVTIADLKALTVHDAGLTAICEAGGLKRQPIGEAA